MWFAMDDSCCGPKIPIYGTNTHPPHSWKLPDGDQTRSGNVLDFDINHAFWITNMVSNYAYTRWGEISPILYAEIAKQEKSAFDLVAQLDAEASRLIQIGEANRAFEILTDRTNEWAEHITKRW